LLGELVPNVAFVILVVNPQSPEVTQQREKAEQAARDLGWHLKVVSATTESEIDATFDAAKKERADAVLISSDPFLHSRRNRVVALAAHHGLPMISGGREWVSAGGLISYGNSIRDAYRRAGLQTGRLLRGVKPSDLPVDRSTKFELAINLSTAKALGLTVPASLLVAADEVIE
jgi:putative ABC transport system substrate-binding protein